MSERIETSETGETPQKSLPELVAEFFDMLARYVREQASDAVQKSVVQPLQKLGGYLGIGIVGATLVAIGAIFIAIGLFELLAALVGSSWAAFLIVGVACMLIAVAMFVVRFKLFKQ